MLKSMKMVKVLSQLTEEYPHGCNVGKYLMVESWRKLWLHFKLGIHSCKHWLDGACDGHLCAESEIPELVMDDNYNIIDGCMLEIFLNIGGDIHKKIEIGNTGKVLPFS